MQFGMELRADLFIVWLKNLQANVDVVIATNAEGIGCGAKLMDLCIWKVALQNARHLRAVFLAMHTSNMA